MFENLFLDRGEGERQFDRRNTIYALQISHNPLQRLAVSVEVDRAERALEHRFMSADVLNPSLFDPCSKLTDRVRFCTHVRETRRGPGRLSIADVPRGPSE